MCSLRATEPPKGTADAPGELGTFRPWRAAELLSTRQNPLRSSLKVRQGRFSPGQRLFLASAQSFLAQQVGRRASLLGSLARALPGKQRHTGPYRRNNDWSRETLSSNQRPTADSPHPPFCYGDIQYASVDRLPACTQVPKCPSFAALPLGVSQIAPRAGLSPCPFQGVCPPYLGVTCA